VSDRIKVVHHSKSVGYSGTDRTAQLFCKYLAQSDKYEPFIVYREHDANERLETVKAWLGDDHVLPYHWVPGKKGRQSPFMPEEDNLHDVLVGIDPDIVHLHRSGYAEWPGFRYMASRAKWVETNIFGYHDNTSESQIDLHVYISEFIRDRARGAGGPDGPILFNPIEQPVFDMTSENRAQCRQELLSAHKLPQDAILLGRVGRADNFDPISLRAFAELEKAFPNVYYIVVNGCSRWPETVRELGIQNVRFVGPIVEDDLLSRFYMGLDIYAHARHDGECCPCNIQEAMMHGLPVVSHESAIYNGQSEIIGTGGFVVPIGDYENYRDILAQLVLNPEMQDADGSGFVRLRDYFGREARRRAMRHFEASCVTNTLENLYDYVLSNV
jgi:glycosyltransferase involved in cell wall biosynthesis